jgi:hypothetical protein
MRNAAPSTKTENIAATVQAAAKPGYMSKVYLIATA